MLLGGVFLATVPLMGDESATVTVGWRVHSAQTLSALGSGRPGGDQLVTTFVVPRPTPADLARGYIERERAITLVARSNTPWILTVRTSSESMGTSFDGRYTKPVSHLQVRAEDGPYVTLARTAQVLARGPSGEYRVGMDYRVLFDGARYREGDYRVTVSYTLSTP